MIKPTSMFLSRINHSENIRCSSSNSFNVLCMSGVFVRSVLNSFPDFDWNAYTNLFYIVRTFTTGWHLAPVMNIREPKCDVKGKP